MVSLGDSVVFYELLVSILYTSHNITLPNQTNRYPDVTECKNDGNAPSWQHNKHSDHEACCRGHFNWDYNNCMGIVPQASYKWYISWGIGKCVMDCNVGEGDSCGGLLTDSWISTHDSAAACCSAHMSYATIGQCKHG